MQAQPLKLLVERYECASRRLTLRTTGGNGQPVEYHINSVSNGWESVSDGFILENKHLGRELKLRARQRNPSGGWTESEISFTPKACGARQAVEQLEPTLCVRVLVNPLADSFVNVEIEGVEGEEVQVELVDQQGNRISAQQFEQSLAHQPVRLAAGSGSGLLLLRVRTVRQSQTVRILKAH
ncbi:hypothetical protein GCM10027592_58380 [Spirosoma flavus]